MLFVCSYATFMRRKEKLFLRNQIGTVFEEKSELKLKFLDLTKDEVENLKLKFSRKLTCFSFILCLVDFDKTINPEDVKQIDLQAQADQQTQIDLQQQGYNQPTEVQQQ